jgi:hypothetical protein
MYLCYHYVRLFPNLGILCPLHLWACLFAAYGNFGWIALHISQSGKPEVSYHELSSFPPLEPSGPWIYGKVVRNWNKVHWSIRYMKGQM